ncbi:BMP family protein [Clostridium boliviensis]|uniref:BMP family protein n=1 Tax=Clostridium boliviensis TaxID=318465 RepID=A0ABU4GTJ6_9CLOT|nr:BMP family protein [Clostridium boliviensis]MDW2800280.1 BMP family protein [Clostridium boliviensis]
MKKTMKTASLIMAAVLTAMSLAACGGTAAPEKTESSAAETTAAETTKAGDTQAAADTKAGGFKVAMVLDSSVSDGGWGASCYQAMVNAAKDSGWETVYTDNVATADYATVMTDYAELGYNLIFAPGNQYTDAVKQVAEEYPEINFALLNGTVETENITSILPDAKQIGYMAGALAGLMSKTNNIGFIGGMELDTTKAKLECYEKAAKKVNPDIKVSSAYAGSFSDTAKGKEIASSMVSTYDVDVMFGDASAVDTGAREALSGSEGRYDIGQPGDLGSADDKIIICSVVTDNAALLKACMKDVEADTFGGQTIYGDLGNGCLSIGSFSNAVPEDIQTQYKEIVGQIQAGTFIQ